MEDKKEVKTVTYGEIYFIVRDVAITDKIITLLINKNIPISLQS